MLVLFDQSTPVPIRPFLREHKVETTSQRTPCLSSRPKPTPRQRLGSSRKRKQEALTKKAAPRRRTPKRAIPHPLIWSAAALHPFVLWGSEDYCMASGFT